MGTRVARSSFKFKQIKPGISRFGAPTLTIVRILAKVQLYYPSCGLVISRKPLFIDEEEIEQCGKDGKSALCLQCFVDGQCVLTDPPMRARYGVLPVETVE